MYRDDWRISFCKIDILSHAQCYRKKNPLHKEIFSVQGIFLEFAIIQSGGIKDDQNRSNIVDQSTGDRIENPVYR